MRKLLLPVLCAFIFSACNNTPKDETKETPVEVKAETGKGVYTPFKLTADLSQLSDSEKKMLPILIEAAKIMDGLFWQEAYGDKEKLMGMISDPSTKEYARVNYGPWDRLGGDSSFVKGIGEKPLGAQFYPSDMTKVEFEASDIPEEMKKSLYTMIRRDESGKLKAIPYREFFKEEVTKASDLLKQASEVAEDASLKKYLELRAEALLTDDYTASDYAWMDMQSNGIDIIIGPIENYEDKLYGYKAAHEAYVLIKDKSWSERLAKYASMLPELQKGLPVDAKYKAETPGADSQLAAFDVVYYAGDCNAGSKTIAVNLPNDEEIQLAKGTRRSQLKNAMRAKFDKILLPITGVLIDESQRKNVTFNAFFANTMFHEVAHGLGIKNTIDGKGTVREALKDNASALEEGKADILGLYMVTKLFEKGEITDGTLEEYYTTFMASIFRSVRFGASSAHGKANMLRFNYFLQEGAFAKNPETGTYKVDFEKLRAAMTSLSEMILTFQGNGDYDGVTKTMNEMGKVGAELQKDLDLLAEKGIPVDVTFEQGVEALGLK
ncbi:MAG: hypothetical protein ACJAWV_003301 [Flammeovirgaceae bacterium]|jgi:hypothetical protein